MPELIKLHCPKCHHQTIVTNKDGTSFCRYCGHTDRKEEFKKPFDIKL